MTNVRGEIGAHWFDVIVEMLHHLLREEDFPFLTMRTLRC